MEPAASLNELTRRAAKFMQLEELREFRNQVGVEARGYKGKEKEKELQNRPVVGRGDKHMDNHRFTRYTSLNAERGRI